MAIRRDSDIQLNIEANTGEAVGELNRISNIINSLADDMEGLYNDANKASRGIEDLAQEANETGRRIDDLANELEGAGNNLADLLVQSSRAANALEKLERAVVDLDNAEVAREKRLAANANARSARERRIQAEVNQTANEERARTSLSSQLSRERQEAHKAETALYDKQRDGINQVANEEKARNQVALRESAERESKIKQEEQTERERIKRIRSQEEAAHKDKMENMREEAAERNRVLRRQELAERRLDRQQRQRFGQMRRGQRDIRSGFRGWTTSLQEFTLLIGGHTIIESLRRIGERIINVNSEFERLRLGLVSLEGNEELVDSQLLRIRELAELPGIGFTSGIRAITGLRGAGITFDQSEKLLKEISNVATLSGATQEDVTEALRQFRQVFSIGRFTQQDLRPILQRIPLLQTAFREQFGTIQAGEVNAAFERQGLTIEQVFGRIITSLEGQPRARADTMANAMERLSDAFDDLVRLMGRDLLPAMKRFTEFLISVTEFVQTPAGGAITAATVGAGAGLITAATFGIGGALGWGGTAGLFAGGLDQFVTGKTRLVPDFASYGETYAEQRRTLRDLLQGVKGREARINEIRDITRVAELKRLRDSAELVDEFTDDLGIYDEDAHMQAARERARPTINRWSARRLSYGHVWGARMNPLVTGLGVGASVGLGSWYGNWLAHNAVMGNTGGFNNIMALLMGFGDIPDLRPNLDLQGNRIGRIGAEFEQFKTLHATLRTLTKPTLTFVDSMEKLRNEIDETGDVSLVSATTIAKYRQEQERYEKVVNSIRSNYERQLQAVYVESRKIYVEKLPGEQAGEFVETTRAYDELDSREKRRIDALKEEAIALRENIDRLERAAAARRKESDVLDELLEPELTDPAELKRQMKALSDALDLSVTPDQATRPSPYTYEKPEERIGPDGQIITSTGTYGGWYGPFTLPPPGDTRPTTIPDYVKESEYGAYLRRGGGDSIERRPGIPDIGLGERAPNLQDILRRPPTGRLPGTNLVPFEGDIRDSLERINNFTTGISNFEDSQFTAIPDVLERITLRTREFLKLPLIDQQRSGYSPLPTEGPNPIIPVIGPRPNLALPGVASGLPALSDEGLLQDPLRVRGLIQETQKLLDEWNEIRDATVDYRLELDKVGKLLPRFQTDARTLKHPDKMFTKTDQDFTKNSIIQLTEMVDELTKFEKQLKAVNEVPKEMEGTYGTLLGFLRLAISQLRGEIDALNDSLDRLEPLHVYRRGLEIDRKVGITDQAYDELFWGPEGRPPTRQEALNAFKTLPGPTRTRAFQSQRANAISNYLASSAESLYDQFGAPSILDAFGIGSGQSQARDRALEDLKSSIDQARKEINENAVLNERQKNEQLLEINRGYEREKREIQRSYEQDRNDAWKDWVRQQLTDFPKLIFQQLNLQLAARATNAVLRSLGLGGNVPITGPGSGAGGGGIGGGGLFGWIKNLFGGGGGTAGATQYSAPIGPGLSGGEAVGAAGLGGTAATAGTVVSAALAAHNIATGIVPQWNPHRQSLFDDFGKDIISPITDPAKTFFDNLHFAVPENDEYARSAGVARTQSMIKNLARDSARDLVDNYDMGRAEAEQTSVGNPMDNMVVFHKDAEIKIVSTINDKEVREFSIRMDELKSEGRL